MARTYPDAGAAGPQDKVRRFRVSADVGVTRIPRVMVAARTTAKAWLDASAGLAGAFAVIGFAAAMSPSLLPRPWYYQGLVGGVSAALLYGLGHLIDLFALWLGRKGQVRVVMSRRARLFTRLSWGGLLALIVAVTPLLAWRDQRQTAADIRMPVPGLAWVVASTLMALGTFVALIVIWRGCVRVLGGMRRGAGRRMAIPHDVAALVASVVVVALILGVGALILASGTMRFATALGNRHNGGTSQTSAPPESPLLSGSSASAESWESLGLDGRAFVSAAASAESIQAVTGKPAKDPIRVYVGIGDGRTLRQATDDALAELDRTDAWSRRNLVLAIPTGGGWINNWPAAAIEYLSDGDSAVAAMQYSTTPSSLTVLGERSQPRLAGTALIDAVLARVAALPAASRPRVYLMGESLGADGALSAFDSPKALADRLDGGLFTGTPEFTQLRATLVRSRDRGSLASSPVIDSGATFRFADNTFELTHDWAGRSLGGWGSRGRFVFLQHASDPVVKWSPDLLWRTPDWLKEPRENSPAQMSWLPVVTFAQVSGDLGMATRVPSGQGHVYQGEVIPAWASILGLDPDADYSSIAASIHAEQRGRADLARRAAG